MNAEIYIESPKILFTAIQRLNCCQTYFSAKN